MEASTSVKLCAKCGELKLRESFSKQTRSKDGLQGYCKGCSNVLSRAHYMNDEDRQARQVVIARRRQNALDNQAYIMAYLKEHPCIDCGEPDIIVLEFDHMRGTKVAEVPRMVVNDPAELKAEIAKCDVRCANCHRRKTWAGRSYRSIGLPKHGLHGG